MTRFLLLVVGLAVLGGVIGYSGLLCPDGRCAITGSWWGGATLGGLIGFAVNEGFMSHRPRK